MTIRPRVNTDPPLPRQRRPRPLRRGAESFTREQLLERQPWWPDVSAQARELLLREATERVLAIGEHLGRNGEPQSHWYCVLEGLLKWTIGVADGRTAT